jgi:hypothetical protein
MKRIPRMRRALIIMRRRVERGKRQKSGIRRAKSEKRFIETQRKLHLIKMIS